MDLARAPRRGPLTARKKGSGYENGTASEISLLFLRSSSGRGGGATELVCNRRLTVGGAKI